MRQWEVTINRLIREAASRRARMIATVNTSSQGPPQDTSHHLANPGGHIRSETVGTTWSSEKNCGQTEACPLFSVQSFEPQANGASSDIIVTVGIPPEYPTETPFTADSWRPSTPSRSIWTPSFHSEMSSMTGDFSDTISEYWSCNVSGLSFRSGHRGL